jgi:hypothetical protein
LGINIDFFCCLTGAVKVQTGCDLDDTGSWIGRNFFVLTNLFDLTLSNGRVKYAGSVCQKTAVL